MSKSKGASLQNAMPKSGAELEPDEDQDLMNDHETQNHLKTIVDAHMIQSDPVKMAKVHKLAGRHSNAIKAIGDINELRNNKYGGKNARKSSSGTGE